MMSKLIKRVNNHKGSNQEQGFSLVELMISMVLGIILIGGVVGVFVTTSRSFNTNEALSEVQTNARIAFEWLAGDIRQAGLLGCDSAIEPDNKLVSTAWWAQWGNSIRGYDSSQTDPVSGGRTAGTDSLVMVGAQGIAYSVEENTPAGTFNQIKLMTDGEFTSDDNFIVCDPGNALIAKVGSYSAGAKTVTVDSGGSPLEHEFKKNSMMSFFGANAWYVAPTPGVAGSNSLFRRSKEKNTAAILNNEMVRGVSDMKLRYHRRNRAQFETATSIGTNWSEVDAVEVTLTLRSSQNASVDSEPIERTFSMVTALRNRVK